MGHARKGKRGRSVDGLATDGRRKKVAEMYMRRARQVDIAAALGISQGTVSKDIAAIREEWRQERVRQFESRLEEELARVDAVEAQAWIGWDRSLLDAEKVASKSIVIGENEVEGAEKTTTTEGQSGDPRYLDQIRNCIEQRLKMLDFWPRNKIGDQTDGTTAKPVTLVLQEVLLGVDEQPIAGG